MDSVLVIRFSSLGDIVLTQPVLAQIRSEGYFVDLLVKPEYGFLGSMLPGVSRVLTSRDSLAPEYKLVLDLHGTLKSRQVTAAVKAGKVIRYHKHSLARRLMVRPGGRKMFWNLWSVLKSTQQVTDWYAAAAIRAGFQPAGRFPQILPFSGAEESAARMLKEYGISAKEKIVVLAPGARWATKRWPVEYFARTAEMLRDRLDMLPVFIGWAQDTLLCKTAAQMSNGRALSLAGATTIATLTAILKKAPVLITNDTGPMHLALAAGSRAVALFGPTVPEFGFAPLKNPRARVLARKLDCRPCSLHGNPECPLEHHNCMRRIYPEEVVCAVMDLIT
ncbi:glycosyltransferase family 9 protein [bacterium]|nr:glycosyltransferase family 9 protein [bacterium]